MTTEIRLDQRPFSIDIASKMMYPDGIFIRSLNGGISIMRVKFPNPKYQQNSRYVPFDVYIIENIESDHLAFSLISDIRERYIIVQRSQSHFYCDFLVNLSEAPVGKHTVIIKTITFIGHSQMVSATTEYSQGEMSQTIEYIGDVWLTDVSYDSERDIVNVIVPQGELDLRFDKFQLFQKKTIEGKLLCRSRTFILPKKLTAKITFSDPYAGIHAPLPFEDPAWWKVVIGIAAAVCLVIAIVKALSNSDDDDVIVTETGRDPDTGAECDECITSTKTYTTSSVEDLPAGAWLTLAIALAIAAFGSDVIDPFRRGEALSIPLENDKTVSETLVAEFNYIDIPLPGTPFKGTLDWKFTRHGVVRHDYPPIEQHDEVENYHYLTGLKVQTVDGSEEYSRSMTRKIFVQADLSNIDYARFKKEYGNEIRKKMPEFFVFGFLKHRKTGKTKTAIFRDDGLFPDSQAFDRIHTTSFSITPEDPLGKWDIMVFVQNVNNADLSDDPIEQAKVIGGLSYNKNYKLKHDPITGVCELTPHFDCFINLI